MDSLDIGMLVNLVPRKLGSLERWILAMGREMGGRGHELHLFTHEPLHDTFSQRLVELNVNWSPLHDIGEGRLRWVRSLRRFDALHLNLLAPRSTPAIVAYLAGSVPVVYVDRFSDPAEPAEDKSLLKRLADRVTVRGISRYVGVSRYVVRRAKERFGCTGTSYISIHNGVDVETFGGSRRHREDSELRLLAAAHLIRAKGIHFALEAVAELLVQGVSVQLRIAGDGPERRRLEEHSTRLGLDSNVDFLGLRDDVPDLMKRSDVFLHPATWGEAFGFTVAEAMVSGCAVVASRVGAIPELIEHRKTGILVDPGSKTQIVTAVTELFQEPEFQARIGSAARKYARRHLGLKRCVRKHVDCIEDAVGIGVGI